MDDDNAIAPTFVAETKAYFGQQPQIHCVMVQQRRQRIVVREGDLVRSGKVFISPDADRTVEDLIQQRALFDSNGFTHQRIGAPQWNPDYRVFADYEYFLQCLAQWGRSSFGLNASVLVDYVQSSEGIIGQSNYGEWATELRQILAQHAQTLSAIDLEILTQHIHRWQARQNKAQPIPAFDQSGNEFSESQQE